MKNLFDYADVVPDSADSEVFETVLEGPGGIMLERIVSNGQVTPEGEWYDQDRDEWVAVLEGEARLEYADGSEEQLKRGDWAFLPAHLRHRVAYTSSPCVWLALHGASLKLLTGLH